MINGCFPAMVHFKLSNSMDYRDWGVECALPRKAARSVPSWQRVLLCSCLRQWLAWNGSYMPPCEAWWWYECRPLKGWWAWRRSRSAWSRGKRQGNRTACRSQRRNLRFTSWHPQYTRRYRTAHLGRNILRRSTVGRWSAFHPLQSFWAHCTAWGYRHPMGYSWYDRPDW